VSMTDRIVLISHPGYLPDEAGLWQQMLDEGLGRLHIRKPGMATTDLVTLISGVDPRDRHKLVIHHHPEVALELELGGVHHAFSELARGGTERVKGRTVSCSVHDWQELERVAETCDYCFISPVYNSISKTGYAANPALEYVPERHRHRKVYALGGINAANCLDTLAKGYYGIALLGSIWSDDCDPLEAWREISAHVHATAS